MRFEGFPFPATVSVPTADPRAAPATVPLRQIIDCKENNRGSDRQPSRLLLTAEGTPAATLTVSLWAQREGARGFENQGDSIKDGATDRRFYLIASGLLVTVGQLTGLPGLVAAMPGQVAGVLGVAGTFPTLFAGGETLDLEIDGQAFTTTFAAGDQSNVQVAAAINAAATAAGVPGTPASVLSGEIQILGNVATSVGEVVVVGGTGASTLGLSGSGVGTDPVPASEIGGAIPPGGKIYVQVTARSGAVDYEVLLRCVD